MLLEHHGSIVIEDPNVVLASPACSELFHSPKTAASRSSDINVKFGPHHAGITYKRHDSCPDCVSPRTQGRVAQLQFRSRVSDPLPPSAALPLTEGEIKALTLRRNLPLARGRRERSERGGRSHIILNCRA
jgi:hypothetical protein